MDVLREVLLVFGALFLGSIPAVLLLIRLRIIRSRKRACLELKRRVQEIECIGARGTERAKIAGCQTRIQAVVPPRPAVWVYWFKLPRVVCEVVTVAVSSPSGVASGSVRQSFGFTSCLGAFL
jgi:hypothetical protein